MYSESPLSSASLSTGSSDEEDSVKITHHVPTFTTHDAEKAIRALEMLIESTSRNEYNMEITKVVSVENMLDIVYAQDMSKRYFNAVLGMMKKVTFPVGGNVLLIKNAMFSIQQQITNHPFVGQEEAESFVHEKLAFLFEKDNHLS